MSENKRVARSSFYFTKRSKSYCSEHKSVTMKFNVDYGKVWNKMNKMSSKYYDLPEQLYEINEMIHFKNVSYQNVWNRPYLQWIYCEMFSSTLYGSYNNCLFFSNFEKHLNKFEKKVCLRYNYKIKVAQQTLSYSEK